MPIFVTTVNATAGTAKQASTSQDEFRFLTIRARPSNGSAVYFGDSSVTSINGYELLPGDHWEFVGPRPQDTVLIADFFFDAATGTDNIDVFGFNA